MDVIDCSALFREPEGARRGAIFVGLGLLCTGIYGYFLLMHSYTSLLLLAMGSANFLAALPDFLPRGRTRLAGTLRIVSILYAIVALAYVILQC